MRFIPLLSFMLVCQSLAAQQTSQTLNAGKGRFRAAVVKVDITPEDPRMLLGYQARKSIGVHDHIYHKIVVLDDGATQFVLVSTDICLISPSEYDKVATQLKRQTGINPSNLWWTVTHTHSAPEVGVPGLLGTFLGERYHHPVDSAYTASVEQKLIEGIKEARKKLVPARLGAGWGFSQANINRRALDIDGKSSLGLNPDGAVDRHIGLLRIEKEDGTLLTLIANYPIHGTVLGGENLQISGDAPGIVSEYVEQQTGVPVLFINGAAGNLAPIYSVYPNPQAGHLGQFRVLVGDRIIDANKKISSTTDQVQLSAGSLIVETPRKPGLIDWPSDLDNYTRRNNAGINMVRLPLRFLKINEDIAIWSAPVELFCEVANEIRERSPFPYTFYFGYGNGWLGYLPTESAWQHGGYETTVSPYTPAAAKDLTESVSGYLQGEMKSLPDRAKGRIDVTDARQDSAAFPWPEGKRAAVSLSFDDARESQVIGGTDLLDQYDIKATFFVVPSAVAKQLQGWKKAVVNGHEIGNHSLSHPCTGNFSWSRKNALEDYTLRKMRNELLECNKRIEALLHVKAEVFAYPCGQKFIGRGAQTRSYVPLVSKIFLLGRGWMDEGANDPSYCNFGQLTGVEMDGKNFDQILPLLEEARKNGQWLVLGGHEMGDAGEQTTRLGMLRQLAEYAKDPANGIWIAPIGTVAKYIQNQKLKSQKRL